MWVVLILNVTVWAGLNNLSAVFLNSVAGNEFFQEHKYADDALNSYLKVPVMAFRPSLEAKLRQLLHNICLHEFKL